MKVFCMHETETSACTFRTHTDIVKGSLTFCKFSPKSITGTDVKVAERFSVIK